MVNFMMDNPIIHFPQFIIILSNPFLPFNKFIIIFYLYPCRSYDWSNCRHSTHALLLLPSPFPLVSYIFLGKSSYSGFWLCILDLRDLRDLRVLMITHLFQQKMLQPKSILFFS